MWKKLPLPIRAVAAGFAVSGIPTILWAALVVTNLRATPLVPWAVPLMAVILWLYWRYLGGTEFRREHRRAAPLSSSSWRLSLLAGGSAVAAVWAAFAALRGIMNIAAPPNDVTRFPMLTVFASIVM